MRVGRVMVRKIMNGERVEIEVPSVGVIIVRNGVCGCWFNE